MQKKRFVANIIIMSSSMLIIRLAAMSSNIYISAKAGATAMGLYHMIFSIFTFGITFASSGTGFAVTRLVSEKRTNPQSIVKKCLRISIVMSFAGFCVFFFFAPLIQMHFTKNQSTVFAIRLLAFALPCMATSAVLRGFFIAIRKVTIITASSIFEEAVCIGVTLLLLNRLAGTQKAYLSLVFGCAVSNLTACIFDTLAYRHYTGKSIFKTEEVKYKSIFKICVPIAVGSYLRTGLVAAENLLIPLQFAKYGLYNGVAEYGIIKAMAMMVIMFPTVFIQSFSSLLIPEMSEMNAGGRKNGIRYVFSKSISAVMMFSVFISLMLFCHHDIISRSFFKEQKVSYYLGMLSLLPIPMYLDTVADSILKGLNLQNSCLRYNIIDSFLRVFAIVILMPQYGPVFYIAMLYISEIFNLTLSLTRAAKVTKPNIDIFRWVLLPVISAFFAFWIKNPVLQTLVYVGVYYAIIKIHSKKI